MAEARSKAALVLSAQRLKGEPDARLRLLEDLRSILAMESGSRFPTRLLLQRLVEIEDAPWSEWKRGRPMTGRGLAELLRPFDLAPVTIRMADGKTPKGYYRNDLERLCEGYLDT